MPAAFFRKLSESVHFLFPLLPRLLNKSRRRYLDYDSNSYYTLLLYNLNRDWCQNVKIQDEDFSTNM